MYDHDPDFDESGCRRGSVPRAAIFGISFLGCSVLTLTAFFGLPGWLAGAALLALCGVAALVLR